MNGIFFALVVGSFLFSSFYLTNLAKMNEKSSKNCCVRISAELHKSAKILACEEGLSLQDWITNVIKEKVMADKHQVKALCQDCGHWKLNHAHTVTLGSCAWCEKKGIPVLSILTINSSHCIN